jgi:hypothetical protein
LNWRTPSLARSISSRLGFFLILVSHDYRPDVDCARFDVRERIEYSEDVVTVERQLDQWLATTPEHSSMLRRRHSGSKTAV